MSAPLYECDVEGCGWENPDWRYGLAEAGATWASHMADHRENTNGWMCDRHHTWMTFASGCQECDDDRNHYLPARGDES